MGFPPQQPALSVGNGPVLTTTLSFLSSRAKPRDLRFRGLFLDMFFDICGSLVLLARNRSAQAMRSLPGLLSRPLELEDTRETLPDTRSRYNPNTESRSCW
jgi:hypothetical protein